MSEIIIFKTKDGHIELNVNLSKETVWLSLSQLSELFGRDKSVVSRHLSNIFKNKELERTSVVANFATTGSDGKIYQVDYYNLDAIISVGYRINSSKATQFRQWATSVLKAHIIDGYTFNEKRLAERGMIELQQYIQLLHKSLIKNNLVNDIGKESVQIIIDYAKTWHLLLAYDENHLIIPDTHEASKHILDYTNVSIAIGNLKSKLEQCGEATALFGKERSNQLKGILTQIDQTFDGNPLYQSIEERAANLLYFIIKDHPFCDGNKRIGCLIFLLYLKLQNKMTKMNDNGLTALALLTAESAPQQKDLMVRLIINMLID